MRVADVLTWGVVSVLPDDPVDRAISLMLGHRVSGLPVIDANGRLVGILTEGDLLRRVEIGTHVERPRWLAFLTSPGQLAEEFTHSHGRKVSELMTERVVTVSCDEPLSEAVDLMTRFKINRVPVLEDGRVVGIVSRADVIRAFGRSMPSRDETRRSDDELAEAVMKEANSLPFPTSAIEITVKDAVVRLDGAIMDDRERNALRVAVENVPGVRGIKDDLVWVSPLMSAT